MYEKIRKQGTYLKYQGSEISFLFSFSEPSCDYGLCFMDGRRDDLGERGLIYLGQN